MANKITSPKTRQHFVTSTKAKQDCVISSKAKQDSVISSKAKQDPVISTEAKRSGEIPALTTPRTLPNSVISTEAKRSGEIPALTTASTLPNPVISTEAKRSGETCFTRSATKSGCPIFGVAPSRLRWAFAKRTAPARPPSTLTRRAFLTTLAAATLTPYALAEPPQRTHTFSVLSLFRPQHLILHADTISLTLLLNNQPLTLLRGQSLILNNTSTTNLKILTPTTFAIEVPNKLRRTYTGTLEITSTPNHLRCIVGIERELAVASIVAAESPSHATPDSLAAQAIAARSFLTGATTSHTEADFCDTTHCQFLREPPPPASPFTAAARRTEGLVLQFRNPTNDTAITLAAMYSRSCGGRTHTLAQLGLPTRNYPYYAVDCAHCRAHPELWHRDIDTPPNTERSRLDYNRIHGWSALPGHIETATALHIEGRGIGHGIGLCQLGAAAMATHGATFAAILTHYYPNTILTTIT